MGQFSNTDVLILAKAITEDPVNYQDSDNTPYYWCDYCDAELRGYEVDRDDFKHNLNCPVLIAQDILTGF